MQDPNPPEDVPAKDSTSPEYVPAEATTPPEVEPAEAADPPGDEPAEADAPPEVEPIEVDLEEFLANHTASVEQVALLIQFTMRAGEPTTIWANLLESMMESISLSVAEDADDN